MTLGDGELAGCRLGVWRRCWGGVLGLPLRAAPLPAATAAQLLRLCAPASCAQQPQPRHLGRGDTVHYEYALGQFMDREQDLSGIVS